MAERKSESTRILVADDQLLYREGLVGLMSHWPEFEVVGDVPNGAEAVEFCRHHDVDLVLMDVQMPLMDGIEATATIHAFNPRIIVVMLTVSNDEETLFDSIAAGAVGYVLKDMASRQLRSCLQSATCGDMILSGAMAEKLARKMGSLDQRPRCAFSPYGKPAPELNEREIELLRLVAQGLSNDEIASCMYISFGTVKKNLQTLMQKLDMPNRVLLAGYAIRAGFAD